MGLLSAFTAPGAKDESTVHLVERRAMLNPLRSVTNAMAIAAIIAASSACGAHSATPPGAEAEGSATVSSAENNPPGDIPDDQAFVAYSPPGGGFSVSVPEGWARTEEGASTVFTDKLNTVRIQTQPRPAPATIDSIRTTELTGIEAATDGFQLGTVSAPPRKAGEVVVVTYRGSSPANPVTGKAFDADFERYSYWHAGQEVILTLSGPVGADNVDPWRIITDSLTWQ